MTSGNTTSQSIIATPRQPTANELFWPAANGRHKNGTRPKIDIDVVEGRAVAEYIVVERAVEVLKRMRVKETWQGSESGGVWCRWAVDRCGDPALGWSVSRR